MDRSGTVLFELDFYINSLQNCRSAIRYGNELLLMGLADEGKKRKEQVDG
jgi:hypothetical protein